ncbi:anti-repressor SinI family protein [Ectobacillus panaciterrae]|nr:anti-repressor SinI family protein [Ectobacillus panaciterrae]
MDQAQAVAVKTNEAYLDKEWLQLVTEAMDMGISREEICEFLKSAFKER